MKTSQMMRMPMRGATGVGAAMGILLTAAAAGAQPKTYFGQKGEFVFSADRLVPVLAFTQNKITDSDVTPNTSVSVTGSGFSVLWGNNSVSGVGGVGGGGNSTFYTTPRVGFDYVFLPNWTIGGDLFLFFTLGGGVTTTGPGPGPGGTTTVTTTTDAPSANAFGLAPRVGYVFGINDVLSFWLRGGLSFYHAGTSTPNGPCNTQSDTTSTSLFGLDIDPQLVISPAPHFAFTAGPAIDVGFAGSTSASHPVGPQCNTTVTTSEGYSSYNIGLTGGLMGWF